MSARRKKDATIHAIEQRVFSEATSSDAELEDICSCPPISSLCLLSATEHDTEMQECADEGNDLLLPTPPALNEVLRTRLHTLFPSIPSLSILLLHVSQLEHIHMTPQMEVVHKRRRYHPSTSVVEQILTNVRRAVRTEDSMYLDSGKGAAIIFPHVDQQGMYTILERVYNNVNLLQAETIVPPLTHETDIVLGIGSYPEQGPSLEHVLASAGCVAHRFTLRPAITSYLWDSMPTGESALPLHDALDFTMQEDNETQQTPLPLATCSTQESTSVVSSIPDATPAPFLQLPTVLSARLKNLLSYQVATLFQCVPVGRDHNRLTIAMANPTDTYAIRTLHEVTGMRIFPVSCDNDALNTLLAERW